MADTKLDAKLKEWDEILHTIQDTVHRIEAVLEANVQNWRDAAGRGTGYDPVEGPPSNSEDVQINPLDEEDAGA